MKTMCGIGALEDSRKLGIANAGLHDYLVVIHSINRFSTHLAPGRTHRTRSDAHFDHIGARQNQLLYHLARHLID
jgi:hypothetical protein